MTCLQQLRRLALRTAVLALIALPALLDSCTSTPGLPSNLPDIALNGSSATPPHHMPGYEYPFDSSGNYVSDWAAEGERRAGRSALATNSDEENWSKSHGNRGSSSSNKKSGPVKYKPGSTKPKSTGTVKYTVKSSDSLSSIARKFGTTTTALKKANGLKSDKARSGAVLVIPK